MSQPERHALHSLLLIIMALISGLIVVCIVQYSNNQTIDDPGGSYDSDSKDSSYRRAIV